MNDKKSIEGQENTKGVKKTKMVIDKGKITTAIVGLLFLFGFFLFMLYLEKAFN